MSTHGFTRRRFLAAGIATGAFAGTGWAAFPDKPIRWIVGYPPGGATDALARMLSQPFSVKIGQTIVIENKPGAGSSVGAAALASSPPDGYTIMGVDNGTLVINPVVYRSLQYNPEQDFRPIGLYAYVNFLLAVRGDSPIRSAAEFLEQARTAKDPIPFASPGIGTPLHLSVERLAIEANLRLSHVAYKGMGPAINDVLAGSVALIVVDYGSASPMVKAGRIRPLATFSPKRLAALPDVPTFDELGMRGFSSVAWQGLVAPRKTPDAVIERLSESLSYAVADPEVKKRYAELGFDAPPASDPQTFTKVWEADKAVWQPLIRNLGIKLDA